MNDTLDMALDGGSEDEQEGEDIMNQVLDEIGIEMNAKLSSVPSGKLPAGGVGVRGKQASEEDASTAADNLIARLTELKE